MGADRRRETPDATPPFLTKELIDGWIAMGEARQKELLHGLELEVQDQLHAFDRGQLHLIGKVEKLAGDGEKDEGSIGRLEKLVSGYIEENRQASNRASEERQKLTGAVAAMSERVAALEESEKRARRVEDTVNRWKLIPVFTRHMWKIIAAIVTLILFFNTVWSKFHPQPVTLTPQQIQEIRKGQ
jgi:hypothetical protein